MSEDFNNHAYDRTIIDYLQRSLLKTIHADTAATEVVICEDVPRSISEVPQERLVRMWNRLQLEENNERQAMNRARMAHDGIPPFFSQPEPGTTDEQSETPSKPKRKSRKP